MVPKCLSNCYVFYKNKFFFTHFLFRGVLPLHASVSIALASLMHLAKCDAKLMLTPLILLSQQPYAGRPTFRPLISTAPPRSPIGLNSSTTLLSSAVLWRAAMPGAYQTHAPESDPWILLILLHNLSLHLAFIGSVAVTLTMVCSGKNSQYWGNGISSILTL